MKSPAKHTLSTTHALLYFHEHKIHTLKHIPYVNSCFGIRESVKRFSTMHLVEINYCLGCNPITTNSCRWIAHLSTTHTDTHPKMLSRVKVKQMERRYYAYTHKSWSVTVHTSAELTYWQQAFTHRLLIHDQIVDCLGVREVQAHQILNYTL